MWHTLPLPWRICLEEAWAAYCAGAIPIGAAITDPTGTVLARGRNRVFSDTAPTQRPHGNPLAHAEMHAFERLDWDTIDPRECILYTTTEPCPLCFGALYMSGLRELHYAARDTYFGSTDLLGTTPTGVALHHTGRLRHLRSTHVDVSQVINELTKLLNT